MKQNTSKTRAVDFLKGVNSLHKNNDPNVKTKTYGEKYMLDVMEAYANIRVQESINQERETPRGTY